MHKTYLIFAFVHLNFHLILVCAKGRKPLDLVYISDGGRSTPIDKFSVCNRCKYEIHMNDITSNEVMVLSPILKKHFCLCVVVNNDHFKCR